MTAITPIVRGADAAPTSPGPTQPVDHGMATTHWTPEDGGTVHAEYHTPNSKVMLGGLLAAGGLSIGAVVVGGRAARTARAAAIAGGATTAQAAQAAARAKLPWGLASSVLSIGGMVGAALLADHFSSSGTTSYKLSRADYDAQRLDDPTYQVGSSSATAAFVPSAVGLTAGMVAGATTSYALRNAPKAVSMGGGVAAMLAAGLGAGYLTSKLFD